MTKSQELIEVSFIKNSYFRRRIRDFLQNLFKLPIDIKGILLFGSVATGKARYDKEYVSDIDLIIISPNLKEDFSERNDEIFELTYEFDWGIQALWWTPNEIEANVRCKFYLILDAFTDGKILYDPEFLLKKLKEKLIRELEEKGVIKKELYWQWPIKKFGDKIKF